MNFLPSTCLLIALAYVVVASVFFARVYAVATKRWQVDLSVCDGNEDGWHFFCVDDTLFLPSDVYLQRRRRRCVFCGDASRTPTDAEQAARRAEYRADA